MTTEQIEIEATVHSKSPNYFSTFSQMRANSFKKGAKWYRENDQTLKNLNELRDDIERQTETMDLIKDSDLIQLFGSVIGRLNIIINE